MPEGASRKPLVVGLTGGIGSGKSAVADAFAATGIDVTDTDALAHALTAPGERRDTRPCSRRSARISAKPTGPSTGPPFAVMCSPMPRRGRGSRQSSIL